MMRPTNAARSWQGSAGRDELQDEFSRSAESRMRAAIRRDVGSMTTHALANLADRARERGQLSDAIALARELDRREAWVRELFTGDSA